MLARRLSQWRSLGAGLPLPGARSIPGARKPPLLVPVLEARRTVLEPSSPVDEPPVLDLATGAGVGRAAGRWFVRRSPSRRRSHRPKQSRHSCSTPHRWSLPRCWNPPAGRLPGAGARPMPALPSAAVRASRRPIACATARLLQDETAAEHQQPIKLGHFHDNLQWHVVHMTGKWQAPSRKNERRTDPPDLSPKVSQKLTNCQKGAKEGAGRSHLGPDRKFRDGLASLGRRLGTRRDYAPYSEALPLVLVAAGIGCSGFQARSPRRPTGGPSSTAGGQRPPAPPAPGPRAATGSAVTGPGTTGGASSGAGTSATSAGSSTGTTGRPPPPVYVDGGYVRCEASLATDGGERTLTWECRPGTYFCATDGNETCAQCLSDSDCGNYDLPTFDPSRAAIG